MPQRVSSLSEIPSVRSYLDSIGAEARSLVTAYITEKSGRYRSDIVKITLDPQTGAITATHPETHQSIDDKLPSEAQAKAIKDEIGNYTFPRPKLTKNWTLPPQLASAPAGDVLALTERDGTLSMVVQRVNTNDGGKDFFPWTLFDDDEWRMCEPGGKLPLYGLQHADGDTVFIHEGPRKAWFCHKLFFEAHTDEEIAARDNHPWCEWMTAGCHVGFHGGAAATYRTDFTSLKNFKNIYIIPDNDADGIRAVRKISPQLRNANVFYVRWSKLFKYSFDMADDWPTGEKFYSNKNYIGPTFEDLLMPGTWATDKIQKDPKKKAEIFLRPIFAEQWRWIADLDLYINLRFPFMIYKQSSFDKAVKNFSHHPTTSTLLHDHTVVFANRLVYRPDLGEQLVHDENAPAAVNVYIQQKRIKPVDGNTKPFQDFLDYLFVVEAEREVVKKWIATLIARPQVFIGWAHLWVSEMQGVGKNTLGEHIIGPLLGKSNCSFPSEQMISNSSFNSWLVRKRLIFISEIFAGHNFATYNKLKDYITGRTVHVNEKFIKEYPLDNWAHFIACSNTEKAMKLEARDRRWFCPELANTYWGENNTKEEHDENFRKLYAWIAGGGLSHVLHWAHTFGDYYDGSAQEAPDTARKQQLIFESMTNEEKLLDGWAQGFLEEHRDLEMVVSDRIIKNYLRDVHGIESKFKSPMELRAKLKHHRWLDPGYQLTLDGVTQSILMSPACAKIWRNDVTPKKTQEWRDWLRKRLRAMNDPEGKGAEFMNRAKQMGL